LITAFATIIAASTVAVFSWRQWKVAKDKLALDLFDRRLKAWEAMSASIVGAFDECYAVWSAGPTGPYADDSLDKSATKAAWNQAHWLFGNEVIVKFAFIESQLARVRSTLFVRWKVDGTFVAREDTYKVLVGPALLAFTELKQSVEPYMMLDKIAVNKPAKA
jgi:hypothetical protein